MKRVIWCAMMLAACSKAATTGSEAVADAVVEAAIDAVASEDVDVPAAVSPADAVSPSADVTP